MRKLLSCMLAAALLPVFVAAPVGAADWSAYQPGANPAVQYLVYENGMIVGSPGNEWVGQLMLPDTAGNPPAPVTGIAAGVLSNQTGLTRLGIPETVTYIAPGAFHGDYALTTVLFAGTQEQADRLFPDGRLDNGTPSGVPVQVLNQGTAQTASPGPGQTPSAPPTSSTTSRQSETAHFVWYCAPENVSVLSSLSSAMESAYDEITSTLGKQPPQKTNVYVMPDLRTLHQAVGIPGAPDWSVGTAYNGAVYIVSPLNPGPSHSYDSVVQCGIHEFVHIVIQQFGRYQPAYLDEGVATYLAHQSGGVRYNIQQDLVSNRLPSLATVASMANAIDADRLGLNLYTYGYAFVDFAKEMGGFGAVTEMLNGHSPTQVLGMDQAALEEAWTAYLYSCAGQQAPSSIQTPSPDPAASPTPDIPGAPSDAVSSADPPQQSPSTSSPTESPAPAPSGPAAPSASTAPDTGSSATPKPSESAPSVSPDPEVSTSAEPSGAASEPTASGSPAPDSSAMPADKDPDTPTPLPGAAAITPKPDSSLNLLNTTEGTFVAGLTVPTDGRVVSVSQLADMFDVPDGCTLSVLLPNGSATDGDSACCTGLVVELRSSDETIARAELIVLGDVLGTGKMSLTQLVRLAGAFTGQHPLEGAFLRAGDHSGTGSISLTDLVTEARMFRAARP